MQPGSTCELACQEGSSSSSGGGLLVCDGLDPSENPENGWRMVKGEFTCTPEPIVNAIAIGAGVGATVVLVGGVIIGITVASTNGAGAAAAAGAGVTAAASVSPTVVTALATTATVTAASTTVAAATLLSKHGWDPDKTNMLNPEVEAKKMLSTKVLRVRDAPDLDPADTVTHASFLLSDENVRFVEGKRCKSRANREREIEEFSVEVREIKPSQYSKVEVVKSMATKSTPIFTRREDRSAASF